MSKETNQKTTTSMQAGVCVACNENSTCDATCNGAGACNGCCDVTQEPPEVRAEREKREREFEQVQKECEDARKRIEQALNDYRVAQEKIHGNNMERYAISEFDFAYGNWREDEMQSLMCNQVIDTLTLISTQGHSGYSIGYFKALLDKLMMWKPIKPLTFEDSEFGEPFCPAGTRQNKRMSGVFKDANGEFTYIDSLIWNGSHTYDSELNRFMWTPYNTFRGGQPIVIDATGKILGRITKENRIKDIKTFTDKHYHIGCIEIPLGDGECEIILLDSNLKEYAEHYDYKIEPFEELPEEVLAKVNPAIKLFIENMNHLKDVTYDPEDEAKAGEKSETKD